MLLTGSSAAAFSLPQSRKVPCEAGVSFEPKEIPARGLVPTHVIYGRLMGGDGGIVSYNVYRCVSSSQTKKIQSLWRQYLFDNSASPSTDELLHVVTAVVDLGTGLDGHVGVVHGGVLAMLIDDVLEHGFEVLGVPHAVTANFSVDFRKVVPAGSKGIRIHCQAYLAAWEGRKLFWKARVVGGNDGDEVLYCEATSLYIIPRSVVEEMKGSLRGDQERVSNGESDHEAA